ncbi:MAG: hypothetical protein KGL39_16260 [Patescibacteria group bacterium]|nr:hypothetical protein [Patescibacteria group bacterium]
MPIVDHRLAIQFRNSPCPLCLGAKVVKICDNAGMARGGDPNQHVATMRCPQCRGTGKGPISTK